MQVQPAHVNQLLSSGGQLVEVSNDAGGVAADLRRIDPCLKVRFAPHANPPFFAVYHESEDKRYTYLVLTVAAHQTASGVWTGLDARVTKRIEEIGHSSYDFPAEVEKQNLAAHKAKREEHKERNLEFAEIAAHAVRKDLGGTYKGRIFLPRSIG